MTKSTFVGWKYKWIVMGLSKDDSNWNKTYVEFHIENSGSYFGDSLDDEFDTEEEAVEGLLKYCNEHNSGYVDSCRYVLVKVPQFEHDFGQHT